MELHLTEALKEHARRMQRIYENTKVKLNKKYPHTEKKILVILNY